MHSLEAVNALPGLELSLRSTHREALAGRVGT
jgi:hypothetical protein